MVQGSARDCHSKLSFVRIKIYERDVKLIGIGVGGEGQCSEADVSAESGGTITAAITPYEDHGDSQNSLTLHLISEDNTQYLTMEYGGEILYWSR